MSLSSKQLVVLSASLLAVSGIVAVLLAKRHDRRMAIAGAMAVAALKNQVSGTAANDSTARGIRIPLYENDSRQPTSVMMGRTAVSAEGGKYLVTDLRVESYTHGPAGTATNFVIEAPQCLIDPARKVASSDGRLVVSRADGTFMTTGIGFEWRQLESVLNISNQVATHLTREGPDHTQQKKP
ncbi:MAG: hypothetical protein WCS99_10175 [Limisphaerales bacterium]